MTVLLPETLTKSAKTITLSKGKHLFLKGEEPENLFYLVNGNIRLSRCSESGQDCTLQQIQQGFLAEASLFSQQGYHCDAFAKETSELLAIPLTHFRHCLQDPDFNRYWMMTLSSEIRRLRTIKSNAYHSIQPRHALSTTYKAKAIHPNRKNSGQNYSD